MMSSFDSYHLVWHVGFVQKIPERRYTPPQFVILIRNINIGFVVPFLGKSIGKGWS